MMRTIIFRGISKLSGKFIYGSYLKVNVHDRDWTGKAVGSKEEAHYIVDEEGLNLPVDPDTLGQFTGLYDLKDEHIFEGDIVSITGAGAEYIREIQFDKGVFHFGYIPDGMCDYKEMNIVGNKHVDKDLLDKVSKPFILSENKNDE